MKTFAIIPGFAEGRWHIRRLATALNKMGLQQSPPEQADVIISHSGGAFLISNTAKPQLHLAINPPQLRPAMIPAALAGKILADFQYHRQNKKLGSWLKRNMVDAVYMFRWRRHSRMLKALRSKTDETFASRRTVVVRNQDDAFCPPQIYETTAAVCFISLAGQHDDVWLRPEVYADLLQSLL